MSERASCATASDAIDRLVVAGFLFGGLLFSGFLFSGKARSVGHPGIFGSFFIGGGTRPFLCLCKRRSLGLLRFGQFGFLRLLRELSRDALLLGLAGKFCGLVLFGFLRAFYR
ncbi:MAG: hypothetical protein G4V63_01180, partial [Candidatus Afipia apatlaquensis]|nr:hypothetical protein [Candidatus Afipia apatlaquensis]